MHTENQDPTPMLAVQEAVASKREAFQAARELLNTANQALEDCVARAQSFEAQTQAAESEAQDARQQWRELLRQSGGILTKDIQKLRANERAAYTLVEELAEFHRELDTQRLSLELDAAEALNTCEAIRSKIARDVSEAAFTNAMQASIPALSIALQLAHEAAVASENDTPRTLRTYESKALDEAFMWHVLRCIRAALPDQSAAVAEARGDLDLSDSMIPEELATSPTARNKRRQQLQQVSAAA